MPKNVLRLHADHKILQEGSEAEVLALLAQFKSPATAVDMEGEPLKRHLWSRSDGLDVVSVAIKAGLPLAPSDVFESTSLSGSSIGDDTAQAILARLAAFERAGFDLKAPSADGATLIQTLARAFNPALMDFLEDRGFDPLGVNRRGDSAFSIVLEEAENAELLSTHRQMHLAAAGIVAQNQLAAAAPTPLAASLGQTFTSFLAELNAEEDESKDQRALWLEHCMDLGAQIPKQADPDFFASALTASVAGKMGGLGASFGRTRGGRRESALRARLEAHALRKEAGLGNGAKKEDMRPGAVGDEKPGSPEISATEGQKRAKKTPRI